MQSAIPGIWSDLKAQDPQNFTGDSITVDECLRYAFKNQPLVRQVKLDEAIATQTIRIALSAWLPQISASANLQDNLKLPVIYLPNFSDLTAPKIPVTTGVKYGSGISFTGTQTLFDREVYIAGRTAGLVHTQASETTKSALINLVVQISKAYYDVLLSVEQLNIIIEDMDRLAKTQHDAYVLFKTGASDNIDYQRATISLNNALASKKGAEEAIRSKLSVLKQLIGYPDSKPLLLKRDHEALKMEVMLDTIQKVNYYNRIEYQLLKTNLDLQKSNVLYNRLGFLPSLSVFADYNINFQNDTFSKLYSKSFPNSTIGATLAIPIFQGTKRLHEIKMAKFQFERMALDTINLKNEISSQYVQAMSVYQSNLTAYRITETNIRTAQDVFNTIKLQYNQGVISYLDVIVAETDLLSARINNLNALYMLMFSKLDVEQALGQISIDY
ncbi:MAG: TolC family protein [Bacteroidales bacterium]